MTQGYLQKTFLSQTDPAFHQVQSLVLQKNWADLDQFIFKWSLPEGKLRKFLAPYCTFSHLEHIISLREAEDPEQEDGIWHDDGSRLLAFSLSLTLYAVRGGNLLLRPKGSAEGQSLSTPPFGEMLIFQTGPHGWEHKIERVTYGQRLVIAGWCS